MSNSAAQSAQFSFSRQRIDTKKNALKLNECLDLQDIANLIKRGDNKHAAYQYAAISTAASSWYESGDHRAKGNLDLFKKGLHWVQPTGYNKYGHTTDGLTPNGFVQVDIDFHHKDGFNEAAQLKHRICTYKPSFIALCAVSPTQYGLKIFAKTDIAPSLMTEDVYRFAQDEIIKNLSTEFCINPDNFDHFGIAQACYLPYDPSVYFNQSVTGFEIDLTGYNAKKAVKQVQNKRKTSNYVSNTAVEHAAKYLIENQKNVTENYDEYLHIIFACLNAFGTEKGEDYARELCQISLKFNESHFQSTVKSWNPNHQKPITGATILRAAAQNGFRYEPIVQASTAANLEDYQFRNLDLFVVNRAKAIEYIKKDTGRKLIICELSFIETIEKELNAKRFDGKKFDGITGVCTYQDLSKLTLDLRLENAYFFGIDNMNRTKYLNTTNQIEKFAKDAKSILFADTYVSLNIARSVTVIDRHTPKIELVVSENPQATFVELIKKHLPSEVSFLDTSESIKKQLIDYECVNRSERYAADHKKTLFVLFDSNVQLLPDAFTQFENVVLVANSEKKSCVNMSAFCAANDKKTFDALTMLDNDMYKGEIESIFYQSVKNQKIAIRRNWDNLTWECCPNTASFLECDHQIKILYSDAAELQKHIDKISVSTHQTAAISEDTAAISEDIKQAKKDLATEKKDEYFEFLDEILTNEVASKVELSRYVARKNEMNRGAKVAYNRLKILLKVNDNFTTCLESVYESYTNWTRTKGRFYAAKVIKTDTKIGKSLQTFKKTTEGVQYEKSELIEIAKATLQIVKGNDTEVWKQIKRICFPMPIRTGRGKERVTMYEAIMRE